MAHRISLSLSLFVLWGSLEPKHQHRSAPRPRPNGRAPQNESGDVSGREASPAHGRSAHDIYKSHDADTVGGSEGLQCATQAQGPLQHAKSAMAGRGKMMPILQKHASNTLPRKTYHPYPTHTERNIPLERPAVALAPVHEPQADVQVGEVKRAEIRRVHDLPDDPLVNHVGVGHRPRLPCKEHLQGACLRRCHDGSNMRAKTVCGA